MKFILSFVFLIFVSQMMAQSLVGKWINKDDETGKEKALIEIFEKDGKYHGKITKLLLPEDKGKVCEKCTGSDKNKPIEGLVFLKNMKKSGEEYIDGTILDPKKGKEYSCTITFKDKNTLNVRGYLGISLLGRNQTWRRSS